MTKEQGHKISSIEPAFSNDSTLKQLGIEYQKLIALKLCFDSDPNDQIWIECKGDVANSEKSIEVKHHSSDHDLSDRSIDVWKTLANFISEHPITCSFEKLVLHTTSSIPERSCFHNWNGKSLNDRLTTIKSVTATKTIKKHHDTVFKADPKLLSSTLDRFSIFYGQPKIKEQWELLKSHSGFISIPEEHKEDAIEMLLGYITKQAINNALCWNINIADFRRDFRAMTSKFTQPETPFHYVESSRSEPLLKNNQFSFLEKMKDIKLKSDTREIALTDYIRAKSSFTGMLRRQPTLEASLGSYDEETLRELEKLKNEKSYDLAISDLNSSKAITASRQLYFQSLNKPHNEIIGVNGTQKYYRDGRVHHLLDETNFLWEFEAIDIDE